MSRGQYRRVLSGWELGYLYLNEHYFWVFLRPTFLIEMWKELGGSLNTIDDGDFMKHTYY